MSRAALRAWMLLAVGALAVAGVLALLLAVARAPGLGALLPFGPDFFYRGLVTHVVFAFQIWFLAMLGALVTWAAPSSAARLPVALAALGALLLLVPTLAGWGEPSLNNYVPVLDHPLFFAGLGVLGLGVVAACLGGLAAPEPWAGGTPAFIVAMAALAFLAAMACFGLAAGLIPPGTGAALRDERLFWGGGHLLQFVNTLMLLAGWQVLAERATGRGPLPPILAKASAIALAAACLVAPLLILRHDVLSLASRQAFTQLLWWGLPLAPLTVGVGLARLLVKAAPAPSPARLALVWSLAVFALGGGAGFFLGVGDTRTPSHYHAAIGGVTLVLIGLVQVVLLPALGRAAVSGRWVRWQIHLFGGGQVLHALGFTLAGASGVPRKTFGLDQGLSGASEVLAMAAVGLGGAVAVIGGIIFVAQALGCLLRREAGDAA